MFSSSFLGSPYPIINYSQLSKKYLTIRNKDKKKLMRKGKIFKIYEI